MPRVPIRLSESEKEWLAAEADRRDTSMAKLGGHAVRELWARSEGDEGTADEVNHTDSERDSVVNQIESLRDRVVALEARLDETAPTERPRASADGAGETAGGAAGSKPSASAAGQEPAERDEQAHGGDDELDGRPAVAAAVRRVSNDWGDTPDRLQQRRQAAAAVLEHAVATGEAVGKSSDAVDELREQYPVSGQNRETWWRKNIRPVLNAVSDYSQGEHGYRVTELDDES